MENLNENEKLAILEELDFLKRAEKINNNVNFFVEFYLSRHRPATTPSFHQQIYSTLSKSDPRTLVVAPRGFAKSTLSSRFYPLWLALTQKAKDIIIVSATVALAKENLRFIRQELEANELILKDFGLQQSDKWTEDHIMLRNGTQIRAKGRGFQIRGFRPDVLILDDLEDEEVIYSKDQRDKLESWFMRTLLPALKPQQKLIYIGTILHQYSLINKLKIKPEFTVLSFKALTDGKSIWEELFPTEYLLKLKTEMGIYAFEAEYQNNPLSLENQPIKPDMLEVEDPRSPTKVRCMAIDPAISEKEVADYSAITIYDRTEDNKFKLIMKERGHYATDFLTDKIIELYEKYKPDRVLIEEFAFQKVVRFVLTEKSRKKGIFIPVATAFVGRESAGKVDKRPPDKLTRLLQVSKLFEQKLVYINDDEVRQELLSFPFGDNDDLVDSTVYALYWLMKYQPGGVVSKGVTNSKSPIPTKPTIHIVTDKNGVSWATHDQPKIEQKSNFINIEK